MGNCCEGQAVAADSYQNNVSLATTSVDRFVRNNAHDRQRMLQHLRVDAEDVVGGGGDGGGGGGDEETFTGACVGEGVGDAVGEAVGDGVGEGDEELVVGEAVVVTGTVGAFGRHCQ